MTSMAEDPIGRDLAATIAVTRQAELELFGALDPDVRERPIREGDWTPKDFQAHLTAWKARQAERFAAAQRGEPFRRTAEHETDAINARLRETRLHWTWDAIVAEADAVSGRLQATMAETDPAVVRGSELLIESSFGNGAHHAQQHFDWLLEAGVPLDRERVAAFVDAVADLVRASSLPDHQRGSTLYNAACHFALDGTTARARPLLVEAFALEPSLVEFAPLDPDLESLRDELPLLAGQ